MNDDLVAIEDQLAALRRRWRVILVCALLVTAAALAFAFLQTPRYSATTQVLVAPVGPVEDPTLQLEAEEIATQVEVIRSEPVASRVIRALDLRTSPSGLLEQVLAEQLGDTRVLAVTATDTSPRDARAIADAFARQYLDYRRDLANRDATAARRAIAAEIASISQQLDTVEDSLAEASETERAELSARRQALLIQLGQAQTRLLETSSSTGQTGGQILVPADLPSAPSEPRILRIAVLGLALGLLLGVGAAFLRDHLDDAVRDDTRLRQTVHRPILGRIPHFNVSRMKGLPTLVDAQGPVGEAFRSLASNVRFLIAAARPQQHRSTVLLITSPQASEGKSSVAANLAVAAARFGMRVILVDGDLRASKVGTLFGVGAPPGLSEALARQEDLDDLLISGLYDGLTVLTAGSPTPNPAELLASPTARELMARLRQRADLVIVDSPPATGVADTVELVGEADLVMLVVRHGSSRGRAVQRAVEQIHQVGADVAGVVVNGIPLGDLDDVSTYGYGRTQQAAEASARPTT